MDGSWGKNGASLIACAALFGLNAPEAAAQAVPGGLNVTADILSSVTVDDNADLDVDSAGTTTDFDTQLTLGLSGGSATNTFEAELGGSIAFEDRPEGEEEDNGFVDPFLRLRYGIEGPNNELGLNVRVRETTVRGSFFVDDDGDFIADDLITDEGDLLDTRIGFDYSLGIDAPFGADLSYFIRDRDYTDTADPDLFDRTTQQARVDLRFQLSPLATASLIGAWREYDAEDGVETDRTTTSVGVGLAFEFTPVLLLEGEVLSNEYETEELGVVTEDDDELTGFLRLTRELPNGDVRFEARSDAATSIQRTTLRVDRRFSTPGADLGFGVGFSDSSDGDSTFLAGFDFERDLPLGVFTANLDQRAVINDEEEQVLRTLFSLGLTREFGASLALDVGLSVVDVQDIGNGDATERTRTEFQIGLRRQIFETWDWTVAYRARFEDEEDLDTAESNAFITTLGRSFSLR
ncbi:MAG: hypothetical protein AAGA71_09255 [Pseudomonadota bacterium]